ncbi:GNAT family N-acetyltransferase [Parerythrobacter lacustris]|uniref:GNAT family N-acetyltransferase n=1 Tax=Parerythrobacter lacustris TaxID=2969984 RepID=A0ABT1XTZ1_9SPHN|nr:GNAT family N-acetyltransferase [Parerythrobacter lacustris]MCR2835107.1 GNAT family N-acetyltransferase [Parerythrobacter lacustris]
MFRDAWPALQEIEADGWVARLTGGDTRRVNSINPLGPEHGDVRDALKQFAPAYAKADLRMIVRVPDFCARADADLATAGLAVEGTTRTLSASLAGRTIPEGPNFEISSELSPDWLAARVGPHGDPATAALLAKITVPALFVTVKRQEDVAAIGFAALGDGIAVIESIRTLPKFQRRGLGRLCMEALLGASARAGAKTACLQVDAANSAGLALYTGLGFDRHLYDYHYRVPA